MNLDGTSVSKELTERVIGVFYKVANELGVGFLESVYQKAMMVALHEASLRAEEQVEISVFYHGHLIGNFRADIVVEGVLILELKTTNEISRSAEAQLINYLRATRIEVGFVFAFGERANVRRQIFSNNRKPNLPR